MKKVKKYNEYLFVKEQVKIEFDKLSIEAENSIGLYSSPTLISCHPICKKILDMGKPIIPFLLEKLNTDNYYYSYMWSFFLSEITNQKPVLESSKTIQDVYNDWKNWYKKEWE